MTEREKKLLTILGVTFFLIISFIGFNMLYLPEKEKATRGKAGSEAKLKAAQQQLSLRPIKEPEITWLERSGTAQTTAQEAQTKLQAYLRKQAGARRVEIRKSDIIPAQFGAHFDRVRVKVKATGMEREMVSWLTAIHQQSQRQVITRLEIKPQGNDSTRIEVDVEVEKWIIPVSDEI